MVDAHCHLQTGQEAGGITVICNGHDIASSKNAVELAQKYSNIWATVGVHPESQDDPNEILPLIGKKKVVAIGECGLDHDEPWELELLKWHVVAAKKYDLPLVVHNRNQDARVLEILGNYSKVMIHCFTSDMQFMQECVNRGWYISFGGILTFKKSAYLREVAKAVPEDRLLVETDSPYLSPEPLRGQINTPANVKIVAETLARIREVSFEHIDKITTANTKRLFKL